MGRLGQKSKTFKDEDIATYERISKELSDEKGVPVSVPQAIKIGMEFFDKYRKTIKEPQDAPIS